MQTAAVSNLNFKGIWVFGDDSKEVKTPQSEIYDDTLKRINEISAINDSIQIKTISSAKNEISASLSEKEKTQAQEIEKKYSKFYNFFLKRSKLRKLRTQIYHEQRLLERELKEDSNIEVKKQILDSMLEALNEGLAKIANMDKTMYAEKSSRFDREFSDSIIIKAGKPEGFNKVAGYEYEKSVLYDVFVDKVEQEKRGEDVDVCSGILFFGPWGNGKTYITKNIAAQTGCSVVTVQASCGNENRGKVMDKILDEAKKAQKQFEDTHMRTIIFLDEADEIINNNSPIKKEFEDFVKTCSKKYHCTVLATTNSPSKLGVNLNDPEVFPVRMSIDVPDYDNISSVLEFYLGSAAKGNLNYDELVNELYKKQEKYGGCYNNGQITEICARIIEDLGKEGMTQKNISDYIKNTDIVPELEDKEIDEFNNEYKAFMGEE